MPEFQPSLFADRYPDRPGHNFRDTSIEAADSIEPHVTKLAGFVLEALRDRPGACFELENALNMHRSTVSARIRELFLKGKIEDTGERRKTESNRNAIVWRAKEGWR